MRRFIAFLGVAFVVTMIAVPAVAHHKDGHKPEPTASPTPSPTADNGSPTRGCDQAKENDGDAYDSTCDGSPSANGSGDGEASGRPCAGCVGAADNKNPAGQWPDGSDDNNGYECDGNQGVGKTNPAHTGCTSELPSPPPSPSPSICVPPKGQTGCIDNPATPKPSPSQSILPNCEGVCEPVVCEEGNPNCNVLPFTGSKDIIIWIVAAVALIAIGTVLVRSGYFK